MTKDPGYYRDLLHKILTEDDDDIPLPPSREELKKQQDIRNWMLANPTEEDKIRAIQQNPADFKRVTNPSEAIKLAYVKRFPSGILDIENPSEALKLAAVNASGYMLQHIKNPSLAVQKAAVSNWGRALKYIANPTPEIEKLAFQGSPDLVIDRPNATPEQRDIAARSFAEKYPRKIFRPGSNFHKMLRYVNDVPGDSRSGRYKHYLGNNPEGMPSFTGDKALDGIATIMGLITHRDPGRKELTYQLRITDKGRRVLAKLDAGAKLKLPDIYNT